MASYMYISSSGQNWDDEEVGDYCDFNSEVYNAAKKFSTRTTPTNDFGPMRRNSTAENKNKAKESNKSSSRDLSAEYKINSDCWPTYADEIAELWTDDSHRRPAYVELSQEKGYTYPHTRVKYNANWLAVKLAMGASMKLPILMKPTPLRLSMTWESHNDGEHIKENASLVPLASSSMLCYDSHSEEEPDEVPTPPPSPLPLTARPCEEEVERHGDSGMMWTPPYNDLEDHDAATDTLAVCGKRGQGSVTLNTDPVGATHTTTPKSDVEPDNGFVGYNDSHADEESVTMASRESTSLNTTFERSNTKLSPDLKHFQNRTDNSFVWSTIAAGYFAVSRIPWSRIALAATGALVDVVTFVAR